MSSLNIRNRILVYEMSPFPYAAYVGGIFLLRNINGQLFWECEKIICRGNNALEELERVDRFYRLIKRYSYNSITPKQTIPFKNGELIGYV